MRFRRMVSGAVWMAILSIASTLGAQDIDSIITSANRKPATIAEEIQDPAERAAYMALFANNSPEKAFTLAQQFLEHYPQSAYLATAYEIAARSSFDLGNQNAGLEFARQSLLLLPENALLLVAVADTQAREHLNDLAISSGRDALEYLDRFSRPVAISDQNWPAIKKAQQAIAHFAIGRALIQKALLLPVGTASRSSLLKEALASLLQSKALNPTDVETSYLLAENYLLTNDLPHATIELTLVSQQSGPLAEQAKKQLQLLYEARPASRVGDTFPEFVQNEQRQAASTPVVITQTTAGTTQHHAYAGSASCKTCHGGIYRQWDQSGMSKMLQPYGPEKVIGDFEKNNEFYIGEETNYRHGNFDITPSLKHDLYARMLLRKGRHYFEIKQSDGQWHSYPVDYVIGSKWQQAYATVLPNQQIHVFPIQYSTMQKRWVNYWKVIDSPGTPRSNPYNWEKFDISTNYKANCAICHTTQLRNLKGGGLEPDNLTFREPGIGCEMCHGPSANHIAAISSGDSYLTSPLDPPVQFDRVSNRDFVSICAQCHMQSNVHTPGPNGELNYSSTGTFFLRSAAAPFAEFSRKGFFKDGRFSQTTFMVEALERSKCFRKGSASCGSCHDPHDHNGPSNNTSLKFKDDPDRMCVNCHTQYEDKTAAAAHTHHASESEASRCVSCHMPRIMDALLFRARSHQIDDIPNAQNTLRFGQGDSPNACLLCHKEKSAQWVQSSLDAWKPKYPVGQRKLDSSLRKPAGF